MRLENMGYIAIESDERSYIVLAGSNEQSAINRVSSLLGISCAYKGMILNINGSFHISATHGGIRITGDISIITVG